jgi:hypothetical protein
MNTLNRAFAILAGLVLIALGAGTIYLMWEPGRNIDINNRYMQVVLDLSLSGSDRILGTLIVAAVMSLGLFLIVAQAIPGRRGPRIEQIVAVPADDARFRDVHQRLDDLQRRVDRGAFAPEQAQLARQGALPELSRRRWSLIDRLSR